MGNAETLTIGAERAIRGSDLLIGARRLLEPFADLDCEKLELIRSGEIAEEIARRRPGQASVLLSGDVGFYSGATALYDKLGDCDLEVIPGISSLSYFCAKLHTPWQDAVLVSAHGREHNACGAIQSSAKTFCITGGATKAEDICRSLVERGLGGLQAAVGERLSYDDERIVRSNVADLAQMSFADLSVLLVWNPRPVERKFGAPSIADNGFWRGSAPMTKEEVRSVCVSKLSLARGSVVYDVGSGSGSVSVECALVASRGTTFVSVVTTTADIIIE